MPKYIIKQIPPEQAELAFYFDCDCYSPAAGGLEYALFIVTRDRWHGWKSGINADTWNDITAHTADMIDGFSDADNGETDYNGRRITYKRVMQENGIKYSPATAHRLRAWAEEADGDNTDPEVIAIYLTITTGRKWSTAAARGYCQGDYCKVIFCEDVYSLEDAAAAGEIYLGAANEYSITFNADRPEAEKETVYGFILADCQQGSPEAVKKTLCAWEGIDPADAVLMIPGDRHTVVTYDYEEVC